MRLATRLLGYEKQAADQVKLLMRMELPDRALFTGRLEDLAEEQRHQTAAVAVLQQRKSVLIHTVDKFKDSFKKAQSTTKQVRKTSQSPFLRTMLPGPGSLRQITARLQCGYWRRSRRVPQ